MWAAGTCLAETDRVLHCLIDGSVYKADRTAARTVSAGFRKQDIILMHYTPASQLWRTISFLCRTEFPSSRTRAHLVQDHLIRCFEILKLPQSELWSVGWWYSDAVSSVRSGSDDVTSVNTEGEKGVPTISLDGVFFFFLPQTQGRLTSLQNGSQVLPTPVFHSV